MTDETEKQLWADLKDAIRDAFTAWGEPQMLPVDRAFERRLAPLFRSWLWSFEAIVRALLTVMALRMIPTLPPRAQRGVPAEAARGAAADRPAAPSEAPDSAPDGGGAAPAADGTAPAQPPSSETWTGVRFQLVPAARKASARKAAAPQGTRAAPHRHGYALALARRFEALIRVVKKPEPHAERLARLLAADRYVVARLLARPKPILHENGLERAVPYGDIVEDALELAWAALRAPAADTS